MLDPTPAQHRPMRVRHEPPDAPARILDGKRIAEELLDALRRGSRRASRGQAVPGLAVVLVGNDPASSVYVRNKRRARASRSASARSITTCRRRPREAELLAADRPAQRRSGGPRHPRPAAAARPHVDATALINRIDPRKDVDGFHPENIGRLALRQRGLRPCTSKRHHDAAGAYRPPRARARRGRRRRLQSRRPADGARTAARRLHDDVLPQVHAARCSKPQCAAPTSSSSRSGRPGLGPGRVDQAGRRRHRRRHQPARRRPPGRRRRTSTPRRSAPAWITPVPGGVGPMTVATLMQNTLEAAEAADR